MVELLIVPVIYVDSYENSDPGIRNFLDLARTKERIASREMPKLNSGNIVDKEYRAALDGIPRRG
jgi:hypothetical protein